MFRFHASESSTQFIPGVWCDMEFIVASNWSCEKKRTTKVCREWPTNDTGEQESAIMSEVTADELGHQQR